MDLRRSGHPRLYLLQTLLVTAWCSCKYWNECTIRNNSGIMSHSSKHNCFICTGCRDDQQGRCPGGQEGRWNDGEDRCLWLSMKDHAELIGSGLPREDAMLFNNQLNPPLPLHPDLHKPYWQYVGIDPLHVIVLG